MIDIDEKHNVLDGNLITDKSTDGSPKTKQALFAERVNFLFSEIQKQTTRIDEIVCEIYQICINSTTKFETEVFCSNFPFKRLY